MPPIKAGLFLGGTEAVKYDGTSPQIERIYCYRQACWWTHLCAQGSKTAQNAYTDYHTDPADSVMGDTASNRPDDSDGDDDVQVRSQSYIAFTCRQHCLHDLKLT